jgi:hypothetical protein
MRPRNPAYSACCSDNDENDSITAIEAIGKRTYFEGEFVVAGSQGVL